jgi:hypothetical protein
MSAARCRLYWAAESSSQLAGLRVSVYCLAALGLCPLIGVERTAMLRCGNANL